jgi:hypothetical protein
MGYSSELTTGYSSELITGYSSELKYVYVHIVKMHSLWRLNRIMNPFPKSSPLVVFEV